MSDSFVFYRSFVQAANTLKNSDKILFYQILADYALDGITPEPTNKPYYGMFLLVKPQIDANFRRRENGEKGAVFGKSGGRPKNPKETPRKPLDNPKETPNVNANVNVNVNDNVNDNVNENANANDNENDNVNANANANPNANASGFSAGLGYPSLERDPSGLEGNPTLEEVTAYGHETGHPFIAARFWKMNTDRAWSINGEPIRDWKKFFDSWAKKERDANAGLIGAGNTDYDAILTEFAAAQGKAARPLPNSSGTGTATEARAAPGGPQVFVDENGMEYAEVKRRER